MKNRCTVVYILVKLDDWTPYFLLTFLMYGAYTNAKVRKDAFGPACVVVNSTPDSYFPRKNPTRSSYLLKSVARRAWNVFETARGNKLRTPALKFFILAKKVYLILSIQFTQYNMFTTDWKWWSLKHMKICLGLSENHLFESKWFNIFL